MSGWIQAAMQQNTIVISFIPVFHFALDKIVIESH